MGIQNSTTETFLNGRVIFKIVPSQLSIFVFKMNTIFRVSRLSASIARNSTRRTFVTSSVKAAAAKPDAHAHDAHGHDDHGDHAHHAHPVSFINIIFN